MFTFIVDHSWRVRFLSGALENLPQTVCGLREAAVLLSFGSQDVSFTGWVWRGVCWQVLVHAQCKYSEDRALLFYPRSFRETLTPFNLYNGKNRPTEAVTLKNTVVLENLSEKSSLPSRSLYPGCITLHV